MEQFLDADAEFDRLEQSLARHLSSGMLATSRTVLDTLVIRPHREPRWTKRLSPFVVLYPLLQSQAWSDQPTEQARQANEVHLLLLIHCFIDDRVVDGQHALASTEIVLAKQAVLAAVRVARDALLLEPNIAALWLETFERYHRAQLQRYTPTDAFTVAEALDMNEQIVADRAAPGVLAVLMAAYAAGQARQVFPLCDAFNRLAVALQWEDDVKDWPHDMIADQQNLILARLPPDPIAADGGDSDRLRAVDQSLVKFEIYASAVGRAARRLEESAALQRRLGATQLADAIDRHRHSVVDLGMQLKRQVAVERTVSQ